MASVLAALDELIAERPEAARLREVYERAARLPAGLPEGLETKGCPRCGDTAYRNAEGLWICVRGHVTS